MNKLPLLPHQQMCQSPIYNDTRWSVRPQHNRHGNAGDAEWLQKPLQAPYYETDTNLMSYDLNAYRDSKGHFKPEVEPSPCAPAAIHYCSFGKPVYAYDHNHSSLTIPTQPCNFRGKTTVPDIACLDQTNLMDRDRLNEAMQAIDS